MITLKDRPDMSPIEVITSVQRRRRWAPEEKRALLEEAEYPGSSVSAVARKYGVNPNQMFHWRKLMREGASVERVRGRENAPRRQYRKTEDDALLPLIREIADVRPTYGYPRIKALMHFDKGAEETVTREGFLRYRHNLQNNCHLTVPSIAEKTDVIPMLPAGSPGMNRAT